VEVCTGNICLLACHPVTIVVQNIVIKGTQKHFPLTAAYLRKQTVGTFHNEIQKEWRR
jgi:hypothetical protein